MLCIVVALPSEARPLTTHWKLARDSSVAPYPLFKNREDSLRLIVGGIGKTAAAAATAWLAAGLPATSAAWLNIGIAGGRAPQGEAFLAHAVRNRADGKSWYPPLVLDPGGATAEVISVDHPERDYGDVSSSMSDASSVYEMEAAGFYPTACRFSTAELVHCLKIISDGPGDDLQQINAAFIGELITAQLPRIDAVVEKLLTLRDEHAAFTDAPPEMERLTALRSFNVNETLQLRRLLERRRALVHDLELPDFTSTKRGKDVLRILRAEMETLPIRLTELTQTEPILTESSS